MTGCQVLVVDPHKRLLNTWNGSGEEAATGLKTVVTWTLTLTPGGTHVRMERSGFRPNGVADYQGANYGWQRFISGLERVVAGPRWQCSPAPPGPADDSNSLHPHWPCW